MSITATTHRSSVNPESPDEYGTPHLPNHFSFSQLTKFRDCGFQYSLSRIYSWPEGTSLEAVLGVFVHRVLEVVALLAPEERWDAKAQRPPDALRDTARGIFVEEFLTSNDQFSSLGLDIEGVQGFRDRGWALIKTYLARLDEQRPSIVSTERKIERLVGGVPMVAIVDRIDTVGNTTRIADYKSGPYKDRNTYKYGNQIHLYAHMVGEEDGDTPTLGRISHPEREIDMEINPERITHIVNLVQESWYQINENVLTRQWERKTSPLCGWCPYVSHCAEGQAVVRERFADGKRVSDAVQVELNLNRR